MAELYISHWRSAINQAAGRERLGGHTHYREEV
jgi:hypothetical protein